MLNVDDVALASSLWHCRFTGYLEWYGTTCRGSSMLCCKFAGWLVVYGIADASGMLAIGSYDITDSVAS